MTTDFDVLVVGSGPSGVMAAYGFLEAGLKVGVVDVGYESEVLPVPELPFSQLRNPEHNACFNTLLNIDQNSNKKTNQTGTQLTPPRTHLTKSTENLLPIEGKQFFPLQSLAKGGLSVGWGAATFTYTSSELKKIGLPDLKHYYDRVSALVGISGPKNSLICGLSNKQTPLNMDNNGQSIFNRYQSRLSRGLHLEPASLAVLTEPLDGRNPNPYHDTEFWNNPANSVFRSELWIEKFKQKYNNFHYLQGRLALKFKEQSNTVLLYYKKIKENNEETLTTKKLILCAGAINSYRIAANSLDCFEKPNPILCNPYLYVPTLNLSMLGKKGADKRHSLAQLFGLFQAGSSDGADAIEPLSLQFYSYRSLFLYRLISETPLPIWAARLWWRTLIESLVVVGVHYPDVFESNKKIFIKKSPEDSALPALSCEYPKQNFPYQGVLLKQLIRLRCLPMGVVKTQPGGSIHYAGTLPKRGVLPESMASLTTETEDGRLSNTTNVHALDSSTWGFLPAKGLTLTLMANSLRQAETISRNSAEWGLQS